MTDEQILFEQVRHCLGGALTPGPGANCPCSPPSVVLHLCTEVDEGGSFHSLKQELRLIWLVIGWIRYLGRDFLLQNEGSNNRILIFSTDVMLHLLCDLEALYIDKTFQVCSGMFTQFFTIIGFVNRQQFPLVYALLSSKTRADYNRKFTYLKEKITASSKSAVTLCGLICRPRFCSKMQLSGVRAAIRSWKSES